MLEIIHIQEIGDAALIVNGQTVKTVDPDFPEEDGTVCALESLANNLATALGESLHHRFIPVEALDEEWNWDEIVKSGGQA